MFDRRKWIFCLVFATTLVGTAASKTMAQKRAAVPKGTHASKPMVNTAAVNTEAQALAIAGRLQTILKSDRTKNSAATDWFVVGTLKGQTGNFGRIQGETNAAHWAANFQKIVPNKRPQWQFFYRTTNQAEAVRLANAVQNGFRQQQIDRAAQARTAAARATAVMPLPTRTISSRPLFATGNRSGSGNC